MKSAEHLTRPPHGHYPFVPVERHVVPAPRVLITSEHGLPKGQKGLLVVPHPNDGGLIGGTAGALISMKGGKPRNDMRVVLVSSGYRGVHGNMTVPEKIEKREHEFREWAKVLGYKPEQLISFRAERTYKKRAITPHKSDQRRMDQLIDKEQPTVVMIPHIADTAQPINYNTHSMVMNAVNRWIEKEHRAGRQREVVVCEYPTNHVPFLPPSDMNLAVFLGDDVKELKHKANMVHKSQSAIMSTVLGRMSEGVGSLNILEDADHRKLMRKLTGVDMSVESARAEHFGLTVLKVVKDRGVPTIVQERMKFPLDKKGRARFGLK